MKTVIPIKISIKTSIRRIVYHILDGLPDNTEFSSNEMKQSVIGWLMAKGVKLNPHRDTILRYMRQWREMRARGCECIHNRKSIYKVCSYV